MRATWRMNMARRMAACFVICGAAAALNAACAAPRQPIALDPSSALSLARKIALEVDLGDPAQVEALLGIRLTPNPPHNRLPSSLTNLPVSGRQFYDFVDFTVVPSELGKSISYTKFLPTRIPDSYVDKSGLGELRFHLPPSSACITYKSEAETLGIRFDQPNDMISGFVYTRKDIETGVTLIDPAGSINGMWCFHGIAIGQGVRRPADKPGHWENLARMY